MCNDHDFDKKLAKIQVYFTALITFGSILIALGISSLDFSSTLTLDSADKPKEIAQYLQQFSSAKGTLGILYSITGILTIFVSIIICLSKINKLKSDKTNCVDPDIYKKTKDTDPYERQQRTLENIKLELQIEEIRLEITKLKNQLEMEKLNQMKLKGKTHDSQR